MRDQWPSTQKRTGQPPAHRGGSPHLTPAAQASRLQSPRGHKQIAVPGTGGASGMWTLRAKPGRSRGNQEGGSLRSLWSLWAQRSGRSAVRAAKGRAASTRGRWRAAPGRGGARGADGRPRQRAGERRGGEGGASCSVLSPGPRPAEGGPGPRAPSCEETRRRHGAAASWPATGHRPRPAPPRGQRPLLRPAPPSGPRCRGRRQRGRPPPVCWSWGGPAQSHLT